MFLPYSSPVLLHSVRRVALDLHFQRQSQSTVAIGVIALLIRSQRCPVGQVWKRFGRMALPCATSKGTDPFLLPNLICATRSVEPTVSSSKLSSHSFQEIHYNRRIPHWRHQSAINARRRVRPSDAIAKSRVGALCIRRRHSIARSDRSFASDKLPSIPSRVRAAMCCM